MSDDEIRGLVRRMSRRDVLKWSVYAGTTAGALSLIEACGGGTSTAGGTSGGTPANQQVQLVYAAQQDDSGTIPKQIAAWNAANPNTQVTYQPGPKVSQDFLTQLIAAFNAKSVVPDVFDSDVIWPGQFAAAGWMKPLDSFLSSSFKQGVFQSAVTVGQYNGKSYAVQRYYDAGRIYYRTDLLQKYSVQVPQTMSELVNTATKIQEGERAAGNQNFWGFYWIGAQIEALFDEFLEWYWGLGGNLLDKSNNLKFDNDQGRKAAQFMYDTIYSGKISPPGTPTYKTPDIVPFMQNGNAAFMRNWGFAQALLDDPKQSKVAGKIGAAPLPGETRVGFGCTGGWCMAMNANTKYPDRSWQFMQYMLGQKGQTTMATGSGLSPVRSDVLNDPQVQAANPAFKSLPDILKNTKSRPQLKNYTQVSAAIQPALSAIMTKQKSVADGVKAAQTAVDDLLNS